MKLFFSFALSDTATFIDFVMSNSVKRKHATKHLTNRLNRHLENIVKRYGYRLSKNAAEHLKRALNIYKHYIEGLRCRLNGNITSIC